MEKGNWVNWLVLFNVLDALSTSLVIGLGLGHEYNPVVRALLAVHPLAFLVVKLTAVAIVWIDYRYWRSQSGTLIKVLTAAYGLLSLYQIAYLGWLLWN